MPRKVDAERTADVIAEDATDFDELLLPPTILRGLKEAGFVKPSPVQMSAIPLVRLGFDIIAQAKSGTGKTCVFAVGSLEAIQPSHAHAQCLILAPTREIALQIRDVIVEIGKYLDGMMGNFEHHFIVIGMKCHAFIGGLPEKNDLVKLQHCQIVVGTPGISLMICNIIDVASTGRVKALLGSGALKPDGIRLLVLDEADSLLSPSFQNDVLYVCLILLESP